MIDVILDSLKDSLSVFVFVFITYIVLSFFESKLINKLRKGNGVNPLFASLFGLIPQCGVSVIAADLYSKKYLSIDERNIVLQGANCAAGYYKNIGRNI